MKHIGDANCSMYIISYLFMLVKKLSLSTYAGGYLFYLDMYLVFTNIKGT